MDNKYTNERLCELIQQGHEEYLFQLWTQCEKFIRMKAEQYVRQFDRDQDLAEDCAQEAYLAFQSIVLRYDPNREAKFLSFLKPSLHSAFSSVMFSGRGKAAKDPLNNCYSLDQPLIDSNGEEYTLQDIVADASAEAELHEIEEDDYRRSQNAFIRECIDLSGDEIGNMILTEMLESNCGYRDAIVKLYGPDALKDEQFVLKLRTRKDYAVAQIRRKSKQGTKEKLMRKYSLEERVDRSGLRRYGYTSFKENSFLSEVERIVLAGIDHEVIESKAQEPSE